MRKFFKTIAIAASLMTIAFPARAALDLMTDTPLSSLEVGQEFSVTLLVTETTPAFDSVSMQLIYDADVIGYLGTDFNSFFDLTSEGAEPAGASGEVTIPLITAGSLFEERAGPLEVLTLHFIARAVGSSTIDLLPAVGALLANNGVTVSGSNIGTVATVLGEASPEVVPLPAAAPLFIAGFGGVAAFMRRRRAGTARHDAIAV